MKRIWILLLLLGVMASTACGKQQPAADTVTTGEAVTTEEPPAPAETEDTAETTPAPMETVPLPTETVPIPAETDPPPTETAPIPSETVPLPTETETIPTETLPVSEPTTEATTPPETHWEPVIPPSPTKPPPVLPPEPTVCGHQLESVGVQTATCTDAGYETLRCSKCGVTKQKLLPPYGHRFAPATCTEPERCSFCGATGAAAPGHQYSDGFCTLCGQQDVTVRILSINVKDAKNNPVSGVTVELYIGESFTQFAGSCVSGEDGKVHFQLTNHSGSYKLVPSHVPEGYRLRKDSYLYQADTGSIVLDILPVILPEDHSRAQYKTGSQAGDFTLTDVNGNTHSLSALLREKKLVILNFWYCSCVPCKGEFPYLSAVYQRYRDQIELLALDPMDSASDIRQLGQEMELPFPLVPDTVGLHKGFGVTSYPMTVFIGAEGKILKIWKDVPFESEEQLDTLLRSML